MPCEGHGEECAAEDAGPEGVGLGEGEGEIEPVEFAQGGCYRVDVVPAAGVRAEGPDGDEGSSDVEGHLYDVGPDDGGHAAFKRVEEGEGGDDRDGESVAGADGDAYDDGDGEDAGRPLLLRGS